MSEHIFRTCIRFLLIYNNIPDVYKRQYFKGGIAPGSHVNVTYIADLETTSQEEVRIIAVTGEDPDTINDKHISFTVTGTIIGSTANTITCLLYTSMLVSVIGITCLFYKLVIKGQILLTAVFLSHDL